jgi:hypothetical protein
MQKTILADHCFLIKMLNGMPCHFHLPYAPQFTSSYLPQHSCFLELAGGDVKYV